MVNQDYSYLSDLSESKSFGFTQNKIHPDYYMNELLEGKKLKISDEEMSSALKDLHL